MSDFVPRTHRGFLFALPPYPTPAVNVLTSEQAAFPVSLLSQLETPRLGWRSTTTGAQEIGMDFGSAVTGVLIVRPNVATITWKESEVLFVARGASGPNVLLSSTLLRRTAGPGNPEAPWYANNATAHLFQSFTDAVGNLPHEHWTEFTRCTALAAVTIFQTVSFRTLVTLQQTGMRLWFRTPPTVAPGATVGLRIVSAAQTSSVIGTATRAWDALEVSGGINHASNTTVSFQIQLNSGVANQVDIANVQAWRGYDNAPRQHPMLDYTTDLLGYQVPTHPDSDRRGLFLELPPGLRYYVFGIPASQPTDDGSLYYSVGNIVGMTEWQSFPAAHNFDLSLTAAQGVRDLEFPSLRRQVLVLSGKRLSWELSLGEMATAMVRRALRRLEAIAPGRPFVFIENMPPASRNIDEELVSGSPLLAIRPAGPPMQGHMVRRLTQPATKQWSGLVEVFSTSLSLEEVT